MANSALEVGTGTHYTQFPIRDRAGGSLSLPLVIVKGRKNGPTLLVTAGSHPTEYAGIEAALQLARRLKPAEVRGRVIVVPFVNLLGFNSRQPGGCPEDFVDIFGAFPGYLGGSVTHGIAYQLFEKLVRVADYVVDLHGGELNESESVFLAWCCKTGNKRIDRQSERLAEFFGPDYLLDASKIWVDARRSSLPNGLLALEAARAGIPAIIGEGGGAGKAGELETQKLLGGLIRICRGVGILRGAVEPRASMKVHDLAILTTKHDGLLYQKVRAGDTVSKGDLLAEIRDWKGRLLQEIRALHDGMITITVDWLPVRAGEYVLGFVRT